MLSVLNSWPASCACRRAQLLSGTLLLLLLLGSASTWAGKYAYGEKFVRVGRNWADAGPVAGSTARERPARAQGDAAYQQQLATLEVQGGPYNDALAEPLTGLGRYHRDQGDLDQAMRLYRRALHVVRINDGLYSERQLPILQELLEAYRVSGDMQALDDRYEYYFHLYGKGRPPFTPVRLRAALAYLRWQREAVRLGIDGDSTRRLLALYQLNTDLLQATAVDSSVALPWYRELVLSQLRNLYLMEDRFASTAEKIGIESQLPLLGNEWDQKDFDRRRLETIQRGALSRGSGLLRDLIERTAGTGEVTEVARLYLELGDWYQWHAKYFQAGEQYRQVVQLLGEQQQTGLLQQWLGEPVELPDNGAFWQPFPGPPAQRRAVVNVRYDVSARGRVSNMQASVADPADESRISGLKRKLAQIRFRPRWVNGSAEAAEGVQRDYELLD